MVQEAWLNWKHLEMFLIGVINYVDAFTTRAYTTLFVAVSYRPSNCNKLDLTHAGRKFCLHQSLPVINSECATLGTEL